MNLNIKAIREEIKNGHHFESTGRLLSAMCDEIETLLLEGEVFKGIVAELRQQLEAKQRAMEVKATK